jgi:acyl carrier protein
VRLDEEQVIEWLLARTTGILGVADVVINCSAPFADAGLSSVQAVELAGDLERWSRLTLSPTLMFDYPTIEAVAAHVVERVAQATQHGGGDGQIASTQTAIEPRPER